MTRSPRPALFRLARASLATGLLLALPAAGSAQNLLVNPGFDVDLAGWQVFSDGLRVLTIWDGDDAGGAGDSGSALVVNFDPDADSVQAGLLQCVPVDSNQDYDLAAALRLPAAQGAVGQPEVAVAWFAGAGCTSLITSEFALSQPAAGPWSTRLLTTTAPAGAQSARVVLQVFKEPADQGVEAAFDDLFFGRSGTRPPCTADSRTLCLNGGRFRVTATWQRSNGTAGNGTAVQLTSDTGYFWFFNAANVEMIVKVLNGCIQSGNYWVFAGGLTNVEVNLTVEDTDRGGLRTYNNPQRTPFQPIQDTAAFGTCP